MSLVRVLTSIAILSAAISTGCNHNENAGQATGVDGTGTSVTGDGGISSGTGGIGAGATGTSGDEAATNQGADDPAADNGTGSP